jgi:hypothetical protein
MTYFHPQALNTKGSDVTEWRGLVSKSPQNDIFFTPEYALLFEATRGETRANFGGEAQLFFYGNERNYIIYPFFKRSVNELPFAEILPPESKDWLDIISPYGYSGPLANIIEPKVTEELWEGFLREFHRYCQQNNIVAEFARLHPFIENHLPLQKFPDISIKSAGRIVYVDLRHDESQIRQNMTKGNKSSVSKARRSGVEILQSKTKDEVDAFYRLYIDTMERNKATRAYMFSREFFNDAFRLLHESINLFSAWYRGQIIAASLFLAKGDIVHYYLSGSAADYLFLCPNNLLLYEVMEWAREQGHSVLNLGGGYSTNDSLFQFKASFSKTTADFYTYAKIHNQELYDMLCQKKAEFSGTRGERSLPTDYFPHYRG